MSASRMGSGTGNLLATGGRSVGSRRRLAPSAGSGLRHGQMGHRVVVDHRLPAANALIMSTIRRLIAHFWGICGLGSLTGLRLTGGGGGRVSGGLANPRIHSATGKLFALVKGL